MGYRREMVDHYACQDPSFSDTEARPRWANDSQERRGRWAGRSSPNRPAVVTPTSDEVQATARLARLRLRRAYADRSLSCRTSRTLPIWSRPAPAFEIMRFGSVAELANLTSDSRLRSCRESRRPPAASRSGSRWSGWTAGASSVMAAARSGGSRLRRVLGAAGCGRHTRPPQREPLARSRFRGPDDAETLVSAMS